MNELFKENQIVKIVPQDVSLSCSAVIVKCEDNKIIVKPKTKQNDLNGDCECFSVTSAGIIYFKGAILTEGDKYKINVLNYTVMQRREYSRIKFNQKICLKQNDKEYFVIVTDLSAGGMKILSENELKMSGEYSCTLELGRTNLAVTYTPIRQEKNEDNSFIISGKFENISHKDRIALIQYSFSRQMESTNK